MKVLITGRNGSLTSSLLLFFNQNKYKVFTTSRKKISKKNNYILDLTKTINIENNFDLVIHCASNHPYTVSTKSKKVLLEENLKMSKNIHEFLIKKKIPKLVFISSVGVYGKVYSKILSENYKSKKMEWYGVSKKKSETIFLNPKNNYKSLCLRVPGILPTNTKKNYPLIINIIRKLIKNEKITLYNPNSLFNNITDTKDIYRVIKIFLYSKKNISGFYNLASSQRINILRLITFLKKKINSNSKIVFKKTSKTSFSINYNKIKSKLKFQPSTTISVLNRNLKIILLK